MSDQERPRIRTWTWASMPSVGKRAYVLNMARRLLRTCAPEVSEASAEATVPIVQGVTP